MEIKSVYSCYKCGKKVVMDNHEIKHVRDSFEGEKTYLWLKGTCCGRTVTNSFLFVWQEG